MPAPHKDKKRRWRVSVYAVGKTNEKTCPLIHKASRSKEIAQHHFDYYDAQIGKGKIGRVILHQGLLYRGYAAYWEIDSNWSRTRDDLKRIQSSGNQTL